MLALVRKLLCYSKVLQKKTTGDFSSNGSVFSVCGFGHSALQSFKCMCVETVDKCVHTQSLLSAFTTHSTAVLSSLHSGVVVLSLNLPSIFTRPHLGFGYLG